MTRDPERSNRPDATHAARPLIPAHFGLRYSRGMELIFEVRDAEEGGYCARALGHAIFTQGDTWEELRANVLEAMSLHFEGGPVHPRLVQLHYVKDELIPVEAA
jgi:predicted RNase H-like HicB family nuclease